MIVFSIVFASFVSVSGLDNVIYARTADNEAGRYLFPMLLAWVSTAVIILFRDFPPSKSTPPTDNSVTGAPASPCIKP
jgi:hypothetical protein